jgi:hypothetical protein
MASNLPAKSGDALPAVSSQTKQVLDQVGINPHARGVRREYTENSYGLESASQKGTFTEREQSFTAPNGSRVTHTYRHATVENK